MFEVQIVHSQEQNGYFNKSSLGFWDWLGFLGVQL